MSATLCKKAISMISPRRLVLRTNGFLGHAAGRKVLIPDFRFIANKKAQGLACA
jgi:hypothetical protein